MIPAYALPIPDWSPGVGLIILCLIGILIGSHRD